MSCVSPGNCAAGGDYANGPRGDDTREFVVSERNGRWGTAAEIRGLGGLNAGADAEDMSLSCGSAGNCAAGGEYVDRSGNYQGFLAVERNGRWGKATGVPGLRALNTGGFADVNDVSCVSPGYCAAGGYYQDRSGFAEGFVVAGQNGRWSKAIEVPGLGALNTGGTPFNLSAVVGPVSCTSAGNCTASGYYTARDHGRQGFVVTERNGRWGKAAQIPGLQALNTGGNAEVGPLSCTSAGNCTAAGGYTDRHHHVQVFVATERTGRWGKATQIPGLQALNTGGSAQVFSVSCGPAGNCAAGGSYTHRSSPVSSLTQGFVVSRPG